MNPIIEQVEKVSQTYNAPYIRRVRCRTGEYLMIQLAILTPTYDMRVVHTELITYSSSQYHNFYDAFSYFRQTQYKHANRIREMRRRNGF